MCDLDSAGVCKMDGADQIQVLCSKNTNCTLPPNPNYMYVQQSDVQPYFDMAEQYTFGDRMFQTNEGPSFPAHQFLISGTSEPSDPSPLFVAENPLGIPNSSADTGCISANLAVESVWVVDQFGSESSSIEPCFDHPSLTDQLNIKGITWRYYAPLAGSIWTAPNAIYHMCMPVTQSDGTVTCTGSDWVNNVSLQTTQDPAPILTEIAAGQLKQVSWVIPNGNNSDHSGMTTTTGGPSWVASIVNAIGNSPYWANTAIIVTWDDWGGWYDHVPPPKVITDGTSWGSGYVYGFRVPLIVISPYAKAGYISKNTHDFGSILNLIEKTFNVPSLGFADAATSDDLSDCFDLTQTPLTFKTINAPVKADFFLHDKRLPTGPDDD
jgi:phospholipase C